MSGQGFGPLQSGREIQKRRAALWMIETSFQEIGPGPGIDPTMREKKKTTFGRDAFPVFLQWIQGGVGAAP